MKRVLVKLMLLTLSVTIPFCGLPLFGIAADASEEAVTRGAPMVGKQISCKTEPEAAAAVSNNKGMSGLDSYIHLHNTTSSNSYSTAACGKRGALTFSFSQIESLGYLYIWNYNVNGKLDNGMKTVRIQYSLDKTNWHDLQSGTFELARALESENAQYGGNAANNLNDGYRTPIDFGGLPVRYVRIIPQSNYGGDAYGLSEVRFFRYKTRPNTGSSIAMTARAPMTDDNAINLTNNYGLSDLDSAAATHTNRPEAMWHTDAAANNAFVVLDLDGTYPVDKLSIWNYNAADKLTDGIKRVKLEYTTKRPYMLSNSGVDYTTGEWTTLGEYEIPIGTGAADMPSNLTIDFGNIQAQHIRITPLENHGGTGYGLSAIRAFAGNGWAVEPSRDWSQLFSNEGSFTYQTSGVNKRAKNGWLAADGIYTLNTNGYDRSGSSDVSTKTLFLFSDTLIGHFNNYAGQEGKYGLRVSQYGMKNNTLATLVGNKPDPRNFQFYLTPADSDRSILGDGNWAQELLRINDKLYAWSFPTENWTATKFILNTFERTAAGFPALATAPQAKDMNFLTQYEQDGTNYRIEFSGAVMDNTESGGATPNPDGYIYAYGIRSFSGFLLYKSPVVARVKPETFEDLSSWRFWNGSDWVEDIRDCAIIDGGDGMVSNEFSVSYMDSGSFAGKYVMHFTNFTQSTMLAMSTADTPYGPFDNSTDKLSLYDCPDAIEIYEANGDPSIYTYNAKAHPHLSAKGELLISYNINSGTFDSKFSYQYLHPQFVTLFDVTDSGKSVERTVSDDGENLAANATVTANAAEEGAANVLDRELATQWASGVTVNRTNGNAITPTWLSLDFGQQTDLNKLVVTWGSGQAKKTTKGYRIEASADGVTWTEVGAFYQYGATTTQNSITRTTDTIKLDPIKTRYLRIYMTAANTTTAPAIRSLKAYNAKTQTAPSPTDFTPTPNAVGATGEVDLDYTAINKLLTEAEQLHADAYTAESWVGLQTALEQALTILNADAFADQSAVDSLTADLQKALDSLEELPLPTPQNPNPQPQTPPTIVKPTTTVKNGWVKTNGKTYYYKNGKLQKNKWITVGKKTYWVNKAGVQVTGTKWLTVKGKKYRLVKGVQQKNKLLKIGKNRYYVNKKGVLQKNKWIKFKNKWYRASTSGKLLQNTVKKIKGKRYRFSKTAVCKNKK